MILVGSFLQAKVWNWCGNLPFFAAYEVIGVPARILGYVAPFDLVQLLR